MRSRPYQQQAEDSIFAEWRENRSTLAVLPTGCGKTILFSKVAKRIIQNAFPLRKKVMVLAHRQELIFQAKDKIERSTGLKCEIEMGDYRAQVSGLYGDAQVIVSTIQTQTSGGDGGGRMTKFDPNEFAGLIIDEAHHYVSPNARKAIGYYASNPNLKILGVTATPDRADEEALGQVFDTVAFDYELLDAIHDGWLVPIEQQMVNVEGLDYSSIRTTAGDLNGADLASVLEAEEILHRMAGPSIEIIGSKRAIVFTSSVKCAETLSEIFNRHRAGMSAWVCGKTEKDTRKKILEDFACGKIQVVCNCGVLTEGFDDPGVEVIIMGRPTKSRSLYSQMVGRSTRPLPGIVDGPETAELRRAAIAASAKPSCLVVDFVGNSGKHKLVSSADILGGNVSDEAVARAIQRVQKYGRKMRMDEALDEEQALIDQEREQRRLEEEARRSRLVVSAKYSTQTIDPFDVLQIKPVQPRGWDAGRMLTEKQRNFLSKAGIDPDSMPYGQAKQLIGAMLNRFNNNLCTYKQATLLKKHGYDPNVSFDKASKIITALKNNGWKRPADAPAPFPVPQQKVSFTMANQFDEVPF